MPFQSPPRSGSYREPLRPCGWRIFSWPLGEAQFNESGGHKRKRTQRLFVGRVCTVACGSSAATVARALANCASMSSAFRPEGSVISAVGFLGGAACSNSARTAAGGGASR